MLPSRPVTTHPGQILLKEFLEPLGLTQVSWLGLSALRKIGSMNWFGESGVLHRRLLCSCQGISEIQRSFG